MNSPSILYSEYIFTSLKKINSEFIDLELHLDKLEKQILDYYFISSAKKLISEIKSQLFKIEQSSLRVRVNIFAKDRPQIFKETFVESDLEFSLNTSELKEKRKPVRLKTFSFYQDQILSKFKLPNYSASFYLKRLAQRESFDDILYISQNNEVIESSTSNVVFKIDGEWFTSNLCIYMGISRQKLLTSNKIKERDIILEDLKKASDAFLINSIEGHVAVDSINNKYFFSNKNSMELFDE